MAGLNVTLSIDGVDEFKNLLIKSTALIKEMEDEGQVSKVSMNYLEYRAAMLALTHKIKDGKIKEGNK